MVSLLPEMLLELPEETILLSISGSFLAFLFGKIVSVNAPRPGKAAVLIWRGPTGVKTGSGYDASDGHLVPRQQVAEGSIGRGAELPQSVSPWSGSLS
jgi:hypothetical protein